MQVLHIYYKNIFDTGEVCFSTFPRLCQGTYNYYLTILLLDFEGYLINYKHVTALNL